MTASWKELGLHEFVAHLRPDGVRRGAARPAEGGNPRARGVTDDMIKRAQTKYQPRPGDRVRIEKSVMDPWGWPVHPRPKGDLDQVHVRHGTAGVVVDVTDGGVHVDYADEKDQLRRTVFEHQYVVLDGLASGRWKAL